MLLGESGERVVPLLICEAVVVLVPHPSAVAVCALHIITLTSGRALSEGDSAIVCGKPVILCCTMLAQ